MRSVRLSIVILLLCGGIGGVGPVGAEEDPIAPASPLSTQDPRGGVTLDSILDSLRTETKSIVHWRQHVAPLGWAEGDSARWTPGSTDSLRSRQPAWKRIRYGGSPRFGFSKVEGFRSGLQLGLNWLRRPGLRIEASYDRAYAPGEWEGQAVAGISSDGRRRVGYPTASRSRLTGRPRDGARGLGEDRFRRRGQIRWMLSGGYAENVVVFGDNRPYGNLPQALLLGLDHQNYLSRREYFAGLQIAYGQNILGEVVFVDRNDRPRKVHVDPLWNTDPTGWRNMAADAVSTRGVIAAVEWTRRSGLAGTAETGLWLRGSTWGGSLDGDREFHTLGMEARRRWRIPGAEALVTEFRAGLVGGSPPAQEMADLGGETSLRAYPHRAFVGSSSLIFRADYVFAADPLRALRLPLLGSLHLQPVLFADLGAVWSPANSASAWREISEIKGPDSGDWRSDLGLGIQRNLGLIGILQRIRLDLAWRTDRSRDRFRASLRLSR